MTSEIILYEKPAVLSPMPCKNEVWSFYGRAVVYILSSDLLTLPACAHHIVTNVLTTYYCNSPKIYDAWKPLRTVMRLVALIAVSPIALIGTLWNSGKAVCAHKDQAKLYWTAAFNDFKIVVAIFTVWINFRNFHHGVPSSAKLVWRVQSFIFWSSLGDMVPQSLKSLPQSSEELIRRIQWLVFWGGLGGVVLRQVVFALKSLCQMDEASLYNWFGDTGIALTLRSRFGVVRREGTLISWDTEALGTQLNPTFQPAEKELLDLIQWMQARLSKDQQLTTCNPLLESESIVKTVQAAAVDDNEPSLLNKWIFLFQASVVQNQHNMKLITQYGWARDRCLSTKPPHVLDELVNRFPWHLWPHHEAAREKCFTELAKLYAKAQKSLKLEDVPSQAEYQSVRDMIKGEARPREFFAFALTPKNVEHECRRRLLFCAPDKHRQDGREKEAGKIFKFLNKLKQRVITDLTIEQRIARVQAICEVSGN